VQSATATEPRKVRKRAKALLIADPVEGPLGRTPGELALGMAFSQKAAISAVANLCLRFRFRRRETSSDYRQDIVAQEPEALGRVRTKLREH